MNDPQGSLWRKWDFHVHTPASFHWNDGKAFYQMSEKEKRDACARIAKAIEEADVSAIILMDYWNFDGYLALRGYLADNALTMNKVVFPGMELRCEAPTKQRLNIHVVLSNELTDQKLLDFRSTLKVPLPSKTLQLSNEALIETARALTPDQLAHHGYKTADLESEETCLVIGCQTALVTRESLEAALSGLPKHTGILYGPFDTYGGLDGIDPMKHPLVGSRFLTRCDIFEARSPEYIDCFFGRETSKNKAFLPSFMQALGGRPKPVVCGSDAHKFALYGCCPKDGAGNARQCWVKADLTYQGVRQLMAEPALRTYIGEEPRLLVAVRKHPTKFIKSLKITKKEDADIAENWFHAELPLNPGLVAVIGNRGSGKSALTDVIGLLGNSRNGDHFTFLSDKRFRHVKNGKAQHFEGTLTWESNTVIARSLDSKTNPQEPESVRYLPQSFIEHVCDDVSSESQIDFNRQLKSVIYSHVPPAEQLSMATLDDLIDYKTSEARQARNIHRLALTEINKNIASGSFATI